MKTCVVYGLKSTRVDEVRYVGQTTRAMTKRMTQHLYYARHKKTALHKWIRREIEDGFSIYFVVFVPEAVFNSTEREVIAECRRLGYRLLNHTDGGGGVTGFKHSDETKKRKSEIAKAYWDKQIVRVRWHPTDEQKMKISAANKGNKSRTGQKHSEETRLKMREWAANNRQFLINRNRKSWEKRRAATSL